MKSSRHKLKKNIKEPFLREVMIELKSAVTADDLIFLAYDVCNISARHTEEEQLIMVNTLKMFYGSQQSPSFEGRKNIASSLIDSDSITEGVIQKFLGGIPSSGKTTPQSMQKEN